MSKALIKSGSYKTLVRRIVREFEELEVLVKNSVARGQWNVGKYIDEHLLENKDKPEYATGFYEQLAKDTGRDRTTLQRAVRFFRAYPICAFPHILTWEHYKGLITVKDAEERKKLEEEIIRNGWDTKKFRKYLSVKRKLAAPGKDDQPVAQLTFTRGRLGVYALTEGEIDFGFKVRLDPRELGVARVPAAEYVEIPADKGVDLKKVAPGKEELYTYRARVVKIVDGDTLDVDLRLGLGLFIEQRLRLRGIDCPEIDTPEGRRAKRFVEARLKDCDFIVVKTFKDRSDKFDRYLADIFYQAGASDPVVVAQEGTYLNQELLNERLAVVYE